jgi:hypothetical protein
MQESQVQTRLSWLQSAFNIEVQKDVEEELMMKQPCPSIDQRYA